MLHMLLTYNDQNLIMIILSLMVILKATSHLGGYKDDSYPPSNITLSHIIDLVFPILKF